jgi:hypothetical protein
MTTCVPNGVVVAYASSSLPCALKTMAGPSAGVVVVLVAIRVADVVVLLALGAVVVERPLLWHALPRRVSAATTIAGVKLARRTRHRTEWARRVVLGAWPGLPSKPVA